jgi:hypothetical protein
MDFNTVSPPQDVMSKAPHLRTHMVMEEGWWRWPASSE